MTNAVLYRYNPNYIVQIPFYAQIYEVLSIDLFGPLLITPEGHQYIFIVKDTSTKWVELFSSMKATVRECPKTPINEILMRYAIPRRLVSDNGVQFISSVMQ